MKLSVAIPTYSMRNGDKFLTRLLESLWNQSFQDFEIVVTDNSDDDVVLNICEYYKTGIEYYRNPNKGMAKNTNEAIKRSRGEYIKIIYMDDYLYTKRALELIMDNIKGGWLVTGCTHQFNDAYNTFNNHYPKYSHDIITGNNTIGSPSVLTIRNDNPLMFDENLGWLLDCDYYRRLYERYGEPDILRNLSTVIGLHKGQVSSLISEEKMREELNYLQKKYEYTT